MDEKTKMYWLLDALRNTLITRFVAPEDIESGILDLIAKVHAHYGMDVPAPNIQYFVSDFKLPKDLLERGRG